MILVVRESQDVWLQDWLEVLNLWVPLIEGWKTDDVQLQRFYEVVPELAGLLPH